MELAHSGFNESLNGNVRISFLEILGVGRLSAVVV